MCPRKPGMEPEEKPQSVWPRSLCASCSFMVPPSVTSRCEWGGPTLEKGRLPVSFQKKELHRNVSGGRKHLTCTVCFAVCQALCPRINRPYSHTAPGGGVQHLPPAGQKMEASRVYFAQSHTAGNSGAGIDWLELKVHPPDLYDIVLLFYIFSIPVRILKWWYSNCIIFLTY